MYYYLLLSGIIPTSTKTIDGKVTAKISLSDCLSCSGCLVSSEEVILSSQGLAQFKELLKSSATKLLVVTVSLPVIASFSEAHNVSLDTAYKKLVSFLNALGVKYVFDTRLAYSLVRLLLSAEMSRGDLSIPIITSECPAWVLYAVKKLSKELLPSLSLIKSQQKVMGQLIKGYAKEKLLENASIKEEQEICHIAICQCNDKKVEASLNIEESKEIDLIITAKEILEYMSELKYTFDKIEIPSQVDSITQYLPNGKFSYREMKHLPLGYIYGLFSQLDTSGKPLEFTTFRNKDFRTTEILLKDGRRLKGALAGGYRNIQRVLALLASEKLTYDFIELYACPGECWGGAELLETKERLAEQVKIKAGTEEYADVAEDLLTSNSELISLFKSKPFEKKEKSSLISELTW